MSNASRLSKQTIQKETRLFIYPIYILMLLMIGAPRGIIHAQSYEGLNKLQGNGTQTFFSTGAEAKAERMAKQLNRVMAFYKKHLKFTPAVTLLVLSQKDWSKHSEFPVYGMPHYTGDKTLIVASENNDFWKSMLPPTDKMTIKYAQLFRETYTNKKGELTMEPFFDLLTIHELGHAYHIQGGLVMQRRWMGELFCNVLLHTYIAEMEPDLLGPLTLFPEMVVSTTDKASMQYTTLEELENNYNHIGQNHPQNYGWYQCRWHVGAGKIFDGCGLDGIKNLWMTLKTQREILDDGAFTELLKAKVHQRVADIPLEWNKAL